MKSTNSKRSRLPRNVILHKKFQKDWERLNKSGRYDMKALKTAMLHLIANDESLPAEYKDHALSGEYGDFRECHIGGDFLLIYYLNEAQNIIEFARAGTHAELFR